MTTPVRFDLITKLIYVEKKEDLPNISRPSSDTFDLFCAEYVFLRTRTQITIDIPREYFTFVSDCPDLPLTVGERLGRRLINIPAIAHIHSYTHPNHNVVLDITRYAYTEWRNDVMVPVRDGVNAFCDPFTWLQCAS